MKGATTNVLSFAYLCQKFFLRLSFEKSVKSVLSKYRHQSVPYAQNKSFFFFFFLFFFFCFFCFFPIHINTIKNIQLNNKYQHLSYYLPSFLIYMFIMRYKICTGFFVKPGNKREGVGSVCEGGGEEGGWWRRGVLPSTEKKKKIIIIEIQIYSSSMDWL